MKRHRYGANGVKTEEGDVSVGKIQILAIIVAVLAAGIIGARLVFPLPSLATRSTGDAVKPASTGILAEKTKKLADEHPGSSGVYLLREADAAFAARMALARKAVDTIDVQYYIWHRDLTGLLLLDELKAAADRGVAVRLLLDDNGITDLDDILFELDAHPNIQVRLYNPFTVRKFKHAGYAFDFFRLNHRMHNKSFTVDGRATIGGGRNIGDEYFGTADGPNFVDLDILVIGASVEEVTDDFADYWNSASAYPIPLLVDAPENRSGALEEAVEAKTADPRLNRYREEIERNDTVRKLLSGAPSLEWAETHLVSDPPTKTRKRLDDDELLVGQLTQLTGAIHGRLDIVSPYFVPGERGTEHFIDLAQRGVEVRILTNAQEATDVIPVHAGYAKYRHRLLEGGVQLYELKAGKIPKTSRSDIGPFGSSGASLHAKTFAVDGTRFYVGSFNFDPRSVMLNTEMGFIVDSAQTAEGIHNRFDTAILDDAYVLSLDEEGEIEWLEHHSDGREVVHHHDPHTTRAARAAVIAIGWLPIQWLL